MRHRLFAVALALVLPGRGIGRHGGRELVARRGRALGQRARGAGQPPGRRLRLRPRRRRRAPAAAVPHLDRRGRRRRRRPDRGVAGRRVRPAGARPRRQRRRRGARPRGVSVRMGDGRLAGAARDRGRGRHAVGPALRQGLRSRRARAVGGRRSGADVFAASASPPGPAVSTVPLPAGLPLLLAGLGLLGLSARHA